MRRRYGLCAGGLLAALFTTVPAMGAGKLADSIPPFTPTNISTLLIDEPLRPKQLTINGSFSRSPRNRLG